MQHSYLQHFFLIHLRDISTNRDGVTNNDRKIKYYVGIFMGYSWFENFPPEKFIRRDGGMFKGIIKTAYAILPKAGIEIMMGTFPGGTHIVMDSVGDSVKNVYTICYNYSSNKSIFLIAS